MNDRSRERDGDENEAAHRLLKEPLLDLLYRLEKLEAAVDPKHEAFTRILSCETGAEQDAALTDMAIRLSMLERKLEE